MVNKKIGLSLVEILVGISISAIVLFIAFQLVSETQKTQKEKFDKLSISTSANLLFGQLQKNMATGDVRFFGFTGRQPDGDRGLGRVLIPFFGFCANLESANCGSNTSLLYVDYNKATVPSAFAVCNLTSENSNTILLDANNETYGKTTARSISEIRVDGSGTIYPSGTIPLNNQSTLALLNPPMATLWTVGRGAQDLNFSSNTIKYGDPVPYGAGKTFPPDCLLNLKNAGGFYDLSGLYTIEILPWVMTKATGKSIANVSNQDRVLSRESFPMRLMPVQLRTVGKTKPEEDSFSIVNCNNSGGQLNCDVANTVKKMSGISLVKLSFMFSLELYNSSDQAVGAEKYRLKNINDSSVLNCSLPQCSSLNWRLPIPVLAGPNFSEVFQKMNATEFSLLKMETLKQIEFSLSSSNREEYFFSVNF